MQEEKGMNFRSSITEQIGNQVEREMGEIRVKKEKTETRSERKGGGGKRINI